MSIKIIVDSTTDIPEYLRNEFIIVPLTIRFGEEEYTDGVNLSRTQFYEKLIESDVLPTTSQATPAAFAKEFEKARGMSMIDLISYRDQPLDNIPGLVKNNIPIILVSGDADTVVPYDENGILIERAYRAAGAPIEVIIKKGGDHHPHSLEDNTPIIEFIKKYDV